MNVIVVPQEDKYKKALLANELYIGKGNGVPRLKENGANYIAPYWFQKSPQGVDTIYEIVFIIIVSASTCH